ncbi:MAG TPA: hypothetical protein VGC80_04960 [Acetobacteraceae bacterium]
MTEMTVNVPETLVEVLEQRAAALGTSPDQWLSYVVTDLLADVPDDSDEGPDEWICR